MSGGVDSSVSLALLKKEGWEPTGVFLKLFSGTKTALSSAEKVCKKLKTPLIVANVQKEFDRDIVSYFKKELKQGRTPNPCVFCNRFLKIRKLLEIADKKGTENIATGHFARKQINKETGKHELLRGKDKEKDQSYYLSFLTQGQLKRMFFPVGELTKKEVMGRSKEFGLTALVQKEPSQDFCFLKNEALSSFLKKEFGQRKGEIINEKGDVLGEHPGFYFFTIGQRKRIGLSGGPFYVKEVRPKENRVVVTKNKQDILKKEIRISSPNFISIDRPEKQIRVEVKTRYLQEAKPATLDCQSDKCQIIFDQACYAPTPGQIAVFYQLRGLSAGRQVCLGGGVIE